MPAKTKADILARRPITPADREQIDRHKQEMLADLALHELRESLGITQTVLAERLAVTRPRVHAIENAGEDLRLSTLERYVDALGGRLRMVAVFDDKEVPLDRQTS